MLTPTQYAILMDGKNVSSMNQAGKENQRGQDERGMKEVRAAKGHDSHEGDSFSGKGSPNPKEQALSSVVIKMLNDRSAEQIPPKA